MADVHSKETRSYNMSRIKGKDTKPELYLRKALWQNDLKGYRNNYKKVPGRPDISFPVKKVALFVNSCFWHRCPHCNYQLSKTNSAFWETKFSKNIARDIEKNIELEGFGWKVLTIWECQINDDINKIITMIRKLLK